MHKGTWKNDKAEHRSRYRVEMIKKMGHGTGVIAQQVEKSNCYCRGLEFGP